MMDITKIPTSELVHDCLESYIDIARCELVVASTMVPRGAQRRLEVNRKIVKQIVEELADRGDTTLFDRREIILGEFSI